MYDNNDKTGGAVLGTKVNVDIVLVSPQDKILQTDCYRQSFGYAVVSTGSLI